MSMISIYHMLACFQSSHKKVNLEVIFLPAPLIPDFESIIIWSLLTKSFASNGIKGSKTDVG